MSIRSFYASQDGKGGGGGGDISIWMNTRISNPLGLLMDKHCVKAVLPPVRGTRPSSTLAHKLLCIGLRYAYSHTCLCLRL